MLKELRDLPPGLVGLSAIGTVTREDYERAFEPIVDVARREGRRLRFLYDFGPEFDGFTPGAVWEDAKLGLRAIRLFDGCAIVSDIGWIRESVQLIGVLMPCPVKVFGTLERVDAVAWLRGLPKGAAVTPRLVPEFGVLVVEVEQALRVQDFDALALTADVWSEAHGELQGIVFHAHEFPGWEDFGSFLRHAQFVHDHHRQVKKVALSVDGRLVDLMAHLGEHFVQAEVKHFGYDELDSAVKWAGTRDSAAVATAADGEAR